MLEAAKMSVEAAAEAAAQKLAIGRERHCSKAQVLDRVEDVVNRALQVLWQLRPLCPELRHKKQDGT